MAKPSKSRPTDRVLGRLTLALIKGTGYRLSAEDTRIAIKRSRDYSV